MAHDPAIDEIRRIRHEISLEVGHDIRGLKDVLARLESQFERPPVNHGKRRTSGCTGAADGAVSSGESSPAAQ